MFSTCSCLHSGNGCLDVYIFNFGFTHKKEIRNWRIYKGLSGVLDRFLSITLGIRILFARGNGARYRLAKLVVENGPTSTIQFCWLVSFLVMVAPRYDWKHRGLRLFGGLAHYSDFCLYSLESKIVSSNPRKSEKESYLLSTFSRTTSVCAHKQNNSGSK